MSFSAVIKASSAIFLDPSHPWCCVPSASMRNQCSWRNCQRMLYSLFQLEEHSLTLISSGYSVLRPWQTANTYSSRAKRSYLHRILEPPYMWIVFAYMALSHWISLLCGTICSWIELASSDTSLRQLSRSIATHDLNFHTRHVLVNQLQLDCSHNAVEQQCSETCFYSCLQQVHIDLLFTNFPQITS